MCVCVLQWYHAGTVSDRVCVCVSVLQWQHAGTVSDRVCVCMFVCCRGSTQRQSADGAGCQRSHPELTTALPACRGGAAAESHQPREDHTPQPGRYARSVHRACTPTLLHIKHSHIGTLSRVYHRDGKRSRERFALCSFGTVVVNRIKMALVLVPGTCCAARHSSYKRDQ